MQCAAVSAAMLISMNDRICRSMPSQGVTGLRLSRSGAFGYRPLSSRKACRARRSRGVLLTHARKSDVEPQEEKKGSFLPNLLNIGTGTQRLKVGQPAPEKPTGGTRRLKPVVGGTQRLQRDQASPIGFLQQLGTQTTRIRRRDPNTVFVAGSTGRLGIRTVRELLLAGFKVRAGARNTAKARESAELATSLGILPASAAKRLEVVLVDLEREDTILSAIGDAGKVVQAIGAAESNALDFGAPKRIDGDAAINLVNAAAEAGVEQYVMVTSLGTGKFGWPSGALNLFGGILIQKRRAEKALEASGMAYCIVRPGGMERPGDDYKRTTNVRLASRDKVFGGLVSRLQVAELITAAIANPGLAENKVVEVVAESGAPEVDYEVLLEQQPCEVSQEQRQRQRETQQENQARLRSAQQELEDAAEARTEAQRLVQQLREELGAKQAAVARVEKEVAPVLREVQQAEAELARLREGAEESSRREEAAKAVLSAARAAQREGRVLSREDISAIEGPILSPATAASAAPPQTARRGARTAPSKLDRALAEEIPKKEIALSLGKAGPQPSAVEKRLAEGIAQKEIAIDSGRDKPFQARPVGRQALSSASTPREQKAEQPSKQGKLYAAKPQQSPEELERLREARAKAAESRATKEQDILARLAAERKEEEAKKAEAAEKRASEARRKAAEKRKAAQAKQEELKTQQEADEKKKAEARTAVPAPKPMPAPKAAPAMSKESSLAVTQDPQKQAKQNAEEARQWIGAWRKGQSTADTSSPSSAQQVEGNKQDEASTQASGPFGGFKFPWQQNGSSVQSNGATQAEEKPLKTADSKPQNVLEAREWIREWRARTLEGKLPENSQANK